MKSIEKKENSEKRKYKSKKLKLDNNRSQSNSSSSLKVINLSDGEKQSQFLNEIQEDGLENETNGLQTIYDLLEWQWDQGKSLILQQSAGSDVASLLDTLHQVKTENDALEAKLLKLQMKKNHLKAVNARLSASLITMESAPPPPVHKVPICPNVLSQPVNHNKKKAQLPKSEDAKQFVPITPLKQKVPISQSSNTVAPAQPIQQQSSQIKTNQTQAQPPLQKSVNQTQIQLPLNQLQTFLSQANLGSNQNIIFQQTLPKTGQNNSYQLEAAIKSLITNLQQNGNSGSNPITTSTFQIANNPTNNGNQNLVMMVNNSNNLSNPLPAVQGQSRQSSKVSSNHSSRLEHRHIEDANRLLQATQQPDPNIRLQQANAHINTIDNNNIEQIKLSKTALNGITEMTGDNQRSYSHDHNFVNYAKSYLSNSNNCIQFASSNGTHSQPDQKMTANGQDNNKQKVANNPNTLPTIEIQNNRGYESISPPPPLQQNKEPSPAHTIGPSQSE